MDQPSVHILHHNYAGRDWVDDALIRFCDDRLKAKVHQFWKLHRELEQKLEEVCIAEDRIADVYLELAPCNQQLLRAEVVEQVKSQHGEAVQLISP